MLPCGPYASKKTRPSPFLPLEVFDNTEFDPRTPQEWISIGIFHGVLAGTPAKALLASPDDATQYQWTDCLVMAFDEAKALFTAHIDGREDTKLPRILVMFKGEDPAKFALRVADAMQRRVQVESELMYNLYVDCMPRDGDLAPSDEQLKHISAIACGKDPATVASYGPVNRLSQPHPSADISVLF